MTGVQNGDCAACATLYTYDGIGYPKSAQYANGVVDEFRHDSRGNTVFVKRAANTPDSQFTVISFESTHNFNLPTLVRRKSVVVPTDTINAARYFYASIGVLDSVIEAGRKDTLSFYSDVTRFKYNSAGQDTLIDGPRTDVADITKFTYTSPSGDMLTQIQANGDVTTYGPRNSTGQRTWVRFPNGDTTRFSFDYRGRLTKIVYASGHSDSTAISLSYNLDGRVTSMSSLQGSSLTLAYDAAGRVFRVSDLTGSFIRYTFDDMGNTTSERVYSSDSTLRKSESYRYDNRHRLDTILGPVNDTILLGYDGVGNLLTLRNTLGKTTQYRYDTLNRLLATVEPLGADSIKTQFEYNKLNLVTKVTDPSGFQYHYKYDDKGRLFYDSSAATGATRYRYDAENNLVWEKNANAVSAGDTIAYTYDSLNRLMARLYPDGQHVRYYYDTVVAGYYQKGRLLREAAPSCTTRYFYDIRGRVVKEMRRAFICPVRLTGDVDTSGAIQSADEIYLVNYVFKGMEAPRPCVASGDVNASGAVSAADIIYLAQIHG